MISVKDLKELVAAFVEAHLESESHYLVAVQVKGAEAGQKKILVLVDGDQGITIDDCIKINRQLSKFMEEEGEQIAGLTDPYLLEVSSPGVDYPLETPRQYIKNIGRKLKISLTDGSEHEGTLTEIQEGEITVEELKTQDDPKKSKKKVMELTRYAFGQIKKSTVIVSFK